MSGVCIRQAVDDDLARLTDIYNHYVRTTSVTFDVEPFSVDQRRGWFEKFASSGRYRLFVAEDDERIAGYASSSPFRPKGAYQTSVETSVYMAPEFHQKGIGAKLYEALFAVLWAEDVHRAYAGITIPNPASLALHTKFGFVEVGNYNQVGRKFGKYWDVKWFEKRME